MSQLTLKLSNLKEEKVFLNFCFINNFIECYRIKVLILNWRKFNLNYKYRI